MKIKFNIFHSIIAASIALLTFASFSFKVDRSQVKQVLEKMNKYYAENENFSLKLTYQAKKNKESGQLLEVSKGDYHQLKTNEYFFEVNNVITICNKNLTLIVDKNTKRIVVADNQMSKNNPINLDIEQSLKYCSSIKQDKNRIDFIYSDSDASPYHKLAVYYNPGNFQLKRVILHPKRRYSLKKDEREYVDVKTVLDINYEHYNQQKVTKDMLSISKFVKKNNNNYSPQKAYSNYELINQIK